ncbi:LacI family DNA-binding transcriptional regulator [Actinotalea fermentans]|uniref:Transcriptional regulator n=1 Tax=Actinotalea fermentans TaxID=43671 RepID=A0A511Z1U7_9CELL|nr:LacI family DNA-binding transcriptional regulator [Actinotalea fermentans]KGM16283.1 LacI family transcriptional regulator [Actinotalea fermentans ATCC 43279 = JCM 9966 = DSM 3133]GEN81411.1 transcriptional regulator [Actinotalea fermentans]
MGRGRVTLADVALAAGVSSTTASLVLSGRGDELRISDTVQHRVREVSESLGYRPNILSVGLRRGSSLALGFVSDTVATSQLAGDLIKGALEAAHERGLMLFIAESEGDPKVERRLLNALLDRQVDGVVLASMFTQTRRLPSGLDHGPAVLLNALPREPHPTIPSVVPDELEAGRAAARLLLEAGHRSIHLVGAGPRREDTPPGTVAGRERLQGILEVLADAGLEPTSGYLHEDWLPQHGWAATQRILAADGAGSAIITFNDRLAFGAYQALHEAGLRVPQDMSLVSFDDAPVAEWLRPGLTTFAIPHYDLGHRAVELLLETIAARRDGGPAPAGVHRLPMPLRARESVAPPRS